MSPSKSLELSGRGEGVTKLRVVFARRITRARPFLLTLVEAIGILQSMDFAQSVSK